MKTWLTFGAELAGFWALFEVGEVPLVDVVKALGKVFHEFFYPVASFR